VVVHNFSYGLLNPGFAYLTSCLGCFLGLQCTARARAMQGAQRARWLVLAAVSIGVTGIWVMHFIAMLGFTIPGQVITYNVPVTIGSMLVAVGVVGVGLFIVGFGGRGPGPVLLGGTIIGIGVASMHYMGMWALRMPDTMSYNTRLVAFSVAIAIVAGTVALWAALRLADLRPTIIASLIMGVAVSGMHYTGMAAMHVRAAPGGGMASMGGGRWPGLTPPQPAELAAATCRLWHANDCTCGDTCGKKRPHGSIAKAPMRNMGRGSWSRSTTFLTAC
jgi:NO-binding membrane sensor protein with MHYT domain